MVSLADTAAAADTNAAEADTSAANGTAADTADIADTAAGTSPAHDPSARHLLARLELIEARVAAAVARRRASDPDPDDRFRGLYISDPQVDALLDRTGAGPLVPPDASAESAAGLARCETQADAAEAAGADLRLRRLARSFGLDPLDVELLLVALVPDLDPRFERLYGYLHDDVTRRRASVGLALELVGAGGGIQEQTHPVQ